MELIYNPNMGGRSLEEARAANSAEDPTGYTGPHSFRPCLHPIVYVRRFTRDEYFVTACMSSMYP